MPRRSAKTQDLNWHDLRTLLAIARENTLTKAAWRLGVDETTVARRLAAAETGLKAQLFQRVGTGALRPTKAGDIAVAHAERVEREVGLLIAAVAGADQTAAGTVLLTAVPLLVNHILVPAAKQLAERHPARRLELIAEPHDLSLTKREADLALRLARPSNAAGGAIVARKIGEFEYAIYVHSGCGRDQEARLAWITYEEGMAALPQARWIATITARGDASEAPLVVNDAEAILQAVRAGLGKSLLPRAVADRERGLRRWHDPKLPPPPTREVWLLMHPDQRPLARIATVIAWIEDTLGKLGVKL